MLDVFGSVFGRSKKENKQQQSVQNGGQQQPQQPSPSTSRREGSGSEGESEGFTVLGNSNQPSSTMYPMILTDEMLRAPPTTTNPFLGTTTTNNIPSASSSAMNGQTSGHERFSSTSTPMDSVPFTPNAFFSSNGSGRQSDNLGRCISTIDRVGHFIAATDYNFSLERGVLRE